MPNSTGSFYWGSQSINKLYLGSTTINIVPDPGGDPIAYAEAAAGSWDSFSGTDENRIITVTPVPGDLYILAVVAAQGTTSGRPWVAATPTGLGGLWTTHVSDGYGYRRGFNVFSCTAGATDDISVNLLSNGPTAIQDAVYRLIRVSNADETNPVVTDASVIDFDNSNQSTPLTVGTGGITSGDSIISILAQENPNNASVNGLYSIFGSPQDSANTRRLEIATTSDSGAGLDNDITWSWTGAASSAVCSIQLAGTVLLPASAPDAPTAPQLLIGDTTLTATWTAPNANNAAIIDYTVTLYEQGNPTPVSTEVTTNTSLQLIGLTNGTGYYATVSARNSEGSSANSPNSSVVTPAAGGSYTPGDIGPNGSWPGSLADAEGQGGADNVPTPSPGFSYHNFPQYNTAANATVSTFAALQSEVNSMDTAGGGGVIEVTSDIGRNSLTRNNLSSDPILIRPALNTQATTSWDTFIKADNVCVAGFELDTCWLDPASALTNSGFAWCKLNRNAYVTAGGNGAGNTKTNCFMFEIVCDEYADYPTLEQAQNDTGLADRMHINCSPIGQTVIELEIRGLWLTGTRPSGSWKPEGWPEGEAGPNYHADTLQDQGNTHASSNVVFEGCVLWPSRDKMYQGQGTSNTITFNNCWSCGPAQMNDYWAQAGGLGDPLDGGYSNIMSAVATWSNSSLNGRWNSSFVPTISNSEIYPDPDDTLSWNGSGNTFPTDIENTRPPVRPQTVDLQGIWPGW